jgi:hypothetical protein
VAWNCGVSIPPLERILSRVVKQDDDCWVWQGALNHGGYGIVQLGRGIGTDKTHRVVYSALVGPIPEGLTLDHSCYNPACCNPEHLEPVTRAENARRQWAAGRADPGRSNRLKTHCPYGHPYDDENTRFWRGKRACRACARNATARHRSARNSQVVVNESDVPLAPIDAVA